MTPTPSAASDHRDDEGNARRRAGPGEVGAERQHRAVAEIDHPDQAEDDREAEGGERQDERDRDRIDQDIERQDHAARPSTR